jgi:hypothetical protein
MQLSRPVQVGYADRVIAACDRHATACHQQQPLGARVAHPAQLVSSHQLGGFVGPVPLEQRVGQARHRERAVEAQLVLAGQLQRLPCPLLGEQERTLLQRNERRERRRGGVPGDRPAVARDREHLLKGAAIDTVGSRGRNCGVLPDVPRLSVGDRGGP